MRQFILSRVVLCLFISTLPLTVRAGSFVLSEQSVSGLGTAFAGGAASAEDVSTLFYNPAGLARLDYGEFQMGLHAIIPSDEFTNQGSRYNLPGTPFNGLPVSGTNDGNAGVFHIIGNTYLSQPIFRNSSYGDLTVGLGITSPFGLETDYSPDWVGRYAALRTKLLTLDIQLQEVAEQAFGERRGALVAIEPKTGEVLAFVSQAAASLSQAFGYL